MNLVCDVRWIFRCSDIFVLKLWVEVSCESLVHQTESSVHPNQTYAAATGTIPTVVIVSTRSTFLGNATHGALSR